MLTGQPNSHPNSPEARQSLFLELTLEFDVKSSYYEGRYFFQGDRIDMTVGMGDFRKVSREKDSFVSPPISMTRDTTSKHRYFFYYMSLRYPENINWIFGMSHSHYENEDIDVEQNDPKLGIIVQPLKGTTIRAAYFRVLKTSSAPCFDGLLISNR